MLRIYRSPEGHTFQYEEGTQPEGYVLADRPKAQGKRRTAQNKAAKADNK